MTDKIEISAVHLSTVGNRVIVAVESGGKWVTVIDEHKDNAYSHIVEASGIAQAIERGTTADDIATPSVEPTSLQARRALRGQL